MYSIPVVQWSELVPGESSPFMVVFKNCVLDKFMTPILGERICLDRIFYNPPRFIEKASALSPLYRGCAAEEGKIIMKTTPRPTVAIRGRSLLVGSINNFGHFIINFLPRLVMAREMGIQADHYIVGEGGRFVDEFFAAAGVDPARIVRIQGDVVALAEQLIVPPMQCWVDGGVNKIRTKESYPSRMRKMFCRISDHPSRVLFISRKNAAWRRLLNESEVLDALRPLGVEEIVAEEYSVAEQLIQAGAAKIIIGAGGTGLNLAGFAPAGSHLLELAHAGCLGYGEWLDALIIRAGVAHHKVLGDMIPPVLGERTVQDADFRIDPELVFNSVESILKHGSLV